jgi:hypothetical protein
MATNTVYAAKVLTGGGTTALDAIDGAGLADGDSAMVTSAAYIYFYELDASSGLSESAPHIISPDDNAGTKRWILTSRIGRANIAYTTTTSSTTSSTTTSSTTSSTTTTSTEP